MTIGQRIAQKRKELGLSQEALGSKLGVSRQSIYKWEADSALPEVDKLIALSRLFGVSVGWLLGVEEPPEADAAPAETGGGLTEAQLKMVEEIAGRYIAAQPSPRKRRRWPWVLAAAALCLVLFHLFDRLDRMNGQYVNLQNSLYRVESSVYGQIGSLSNRVEEILKAQNSLVADCGVELEAVDLAANTVTFSAYAVPKTYVEGMAVEFLAENGETASDRLGSVGEEGPNQRFSATLSVPLTDHITLSALLVPPDGTRQTQLLDQYQGLYQDSFPQVEPMDLSSVMYSKRGKNGRFALPEGYITVGGERASVPVVNEALGVSRLREVRVGLFHNFKLVTWLEPCEKPDSFEGFAGQDFYRLDPMELDLAEGDDLAFAAVVTDEYGRRWVSPSIPEYQVQDGEILWPEESVVYQKNTLADWGLE